MGTTLLSREIAELYFDEMVEADRNRDHEAWMKRWKDSDYSQDQYLTDRDGISNDLGPYIRRQYIGYVCCTQDDGTTKYQRYAWLSTHEKAQAVTTVGIFEHEGEIYLNEKWFSYGEDSMYMLLLNHVPKN